MGPPPEARTLPSPHPAPLLVGGDPSTILLLLVIKKISQLPFSGCLATPKAGMGGARGRRDGEDSGANLETKGRMVGWGDSAPELGADLAGAAPHPRVSHQ